MNEALSLPKQAHSWCSFGSLMAELAAVNASCVTSARNIDRNLLASSVKALILTSTHLLSTVVIL